MKRISFILAVMISGTVLAQTGYQQSGNTTYFSNGETAQRSGNTTYFSNGETAQRSGNTTYFSNGKTCTSSGNTVYCN